MIRRVLSVISAGVVAGLVAVACSSDGVTRPARPRQGHDGSGGGHHGGGRHHDDGGAADLAVFDGKTVGILSLAPGLEPVDRIQAGVVDCVEANGGSTQVFDAKGGTEAVQAFEQANGAGVDAIYNIANDVSTGSLDAASRPRAKPTGPWSPHGAGSAPARTPSPASSSSRRLASAST